MFKIKHLNNRRKDTVFGYVRDETIQLALHIPVNISYICLQFYGPELHKDIKELIGLIFDNNMMEKQVQDIGYNISKLPLKQVDKNIITKAYKLLKDIESVITNHNNDQKKKSNNLKQLSLSYYELIPHEFGFRIPPSINTEKLLHKETLLIQLLSDIEVAIRLTENNFAMSVEQHFELLKCDMESINKSSVEFKMLNDYMKLTHAETHNRYKLEIECAYKLYKWSDNRFDKYLTNNNRMLLWHGCKLPRFVSVLSQGLTILPMESPVTGFFFGRGMYFSDMSSKQANFCFTSPENTVGLILLCEVALGDMNELLHVDYCANNLPQGKLSTKGCGITTPNPSTYKILNNGCVVPVGKGIKDYAVGSSLLYSEYVVYDTAQIKMKYLLKLKFDYT
eukprot:548167_1